MFALKLENIHFKGFTVIITKCENYWKLFFLLMILNFFTMIIITATLVIRNVIIVIFKIVS